MTSGPHDPDLPPALAAAQSSARLVPAWIRVPVLVAALAAAGYQLVAQVGVAGWLIEVQTELFDGFYVVLTGLLTLLVCIVPAALLIQGLALVLPKR